MGGGQIMGGGGWIMGGIMGGVDHGGGGGCMGSSVGPWTKWGMLKLDYILCTYMCMIILSAFIY